MQNTLKYCLKMMFYRGVYIYHYFIVVFYLILIIHYFIIAFYLILIIRSIRFKLTGMMASNVTIILQVRFVKRRSDRSNKDTLIYLG